MPTKKSIWKADPPPMRTLLHVDMNAFFASVEQRARPALRGRPVAVVGDLSRRSVVLTSSYEARKTGVKTGMLLHEARKLCPGLVPVEGDFEKYQNASAQILAVLTTLTDRVEMTSCDEAYLDMTPPLPSSADPWFLAENAARRLQRRLKEELGLPCSVGVASNKLLAKLASDMKKPEGITVLRPEEVRALLADLPVEHLCGVGEKTRRHLADLGIKTCGELGAANFETLYRRFGAWGWWLSRMGQGVDGSPVRRPGDPEAVKSVGHSTTFPQNTADPEVVASYLMVLCEKVGRRLRRQGLQGRTVSLTLRTADFETFSRQAVLGEPTDDDVEIYKRAERVLKGFFPLSKAVRLVGVGVSQLARSQNVQSLWADFEKPRRAAQAMDQLNGKFGRHTLYHGRIAAALQRGLFQPPIPPGHRVS